MDASIGVRVVAPAKVNLALRVGARRPDGYHEIDTLFQAIDLTDRIELHLGGEGVSLEVEGEDAGPPADNLVARAARAFLAAAGEGAPGVRIRLTKRIPAGAGLGGGSSDAAATLRGLAALLPGCVAPGRLDEIAAGLGSDVPFFLDGAPLASGSGRGERLRPLAPLPPLPGIVVMPSAHVPTGEAYARLARAREGRGRTLEPVGPVASWDDVARRAVNDFEEVVPGWLPEVGRSLEALRAVRPLLSLLSGSGAACFALFRTAGEADRAVSEPEFGGVGRVFRVRTLERWPGFESLPAEAAPIPPA